MAFTYTMIAVAILAIWGVTAHEGDPVDKFALEAFAGTQVQRTSMEGRLEELEDALHPMYASMPKGVDGRLGPPAVRYMLHRYFVETHAWYVKGLEKTGEIGDLTRGSKEAKTAPNVRDFFERRMEGQTLGLHEIAVVAATLEHLVQKEAVDRLSGAYRAAGLGLVKQWASETELEKAIDTYMMIYVLGMNHSTIVLKDVRLQSSTVGDSYPSWSDTQSWVRQLKEEVLINTDKRSHFNFEDAKLVVEEIGSRYGRWQDRECKDLKKTLTDIENQGTGRVLLKDFYSVALAGHWQFSESRAYLRQLNALDESDPVYPSVIVPNYLNSISNCVSSSEFYAVCCLDECGALLSHIERKIAAPEATPGRIAQLVEALPSATVEAPRLLSAPLRGRLDEIADHHGGRVPLHGRLFAQWMHHAYPRECSFPQVTSATQEILPKPYMTHADWAMTHADGVADKADMQRHADLPRPSATPEIPWKLDEILYVSPPSQRNGIAHSIWVIGRCLFALIALASLALNVRGTWNSGINSLASLKNRMVSQAPKTPAGRRVIKELSRTPLDKTQQQQQQQHQILMGKQKHSVAFGSSSSVDISSSQVGPMSAPEETGSIKSAPASTHEEKLLCQKKVSDQGVETKDRGEAVRDIPPPIREELTPDEERQKKLRELEQQLQAARESEAFFRKHAADATKALSEKNPAHKTLKKCASEDVPISWDCTNCGNTNPVAGFRCIKCDMTLKQANARRTKLADVKSRTPEIAIYSEMWDENS